MSTFTSYSDEQLVALLKTSNEPAFAELYRRYWEKLLVHATHKLKSEMEAEEVVQTVFLNIWKIRRELELRHSFHTYIASCVKYGILDSLAKGKRKKDLEKGYASQANAHHHSTEDWLEFKTTRQKLEETVQDLPDKCQLVFRLSREEGLSTKQISEHMDISGKTVQAHMTKALKALRSSLQQFFSFVF